MNCIKAKHPLFCSKITQATQTLSVAIPRLPTASHSFSMPWNVRRPSSSSSTHTVSNPRASSVDDPCDVPDLVNEDLLMDEVFASDNECIQEIIKALHYLSEEESLKNETGVDESNLDEERKDFDVEGATKMWPPTP